MVVSTSASHFWDTCVLARHLTQKPEELVGDIARMLDEAHAKKRRIWYSTILYAELRSDFLTQSENCPYKTIEDLIKAIEGIMNPISPIPPIMKRAGRLRGFKFRRADAPAGEKNRVLTVADAVQLATCLYVKESMGISDVEFHTFDDGKGRNYDVTLDEKVVSLLRFEQYAEQYRHDSNIDAVCQLKRIRPQLAQSSAF